MFNVSDFGQCLCNMNTLFYSPFYRAVVLHILAAALTQYRWYFPHADYRFLELGNYLVTTHAECFMSFRTPRLIAESIFLNGERKTLG